MTLTQVLMALAIFSLISMGVMTLIYKRVKNEQENRFREGMVSARYTILRFLNNENTWRTILNDGLTQAQIAGGMAGTNMAKAGFECVRASTPGFPLLDCRSRWNDPATFARSGNLVIYTGRYDELAPPEIYYDPNIPTAGFNRDGEPCNTYSTVNPDYFCPIRVDVKWNWECSASAADTCRPPDVTVSVEFTISQPAGTKTIAINPANYNFTVQK